MKSNSLTAHAGKWVIIFETEEVIEEYYICWGVEPVNPLKTETIILRSDKTYWNLLRGIDPIIYPVGDKRYIIYGRNPEDWLINESGLVEASVDEDMFSGYDDLYHSIPSARSSSGESLICARASCLIENTRAQEVFLLHELRNKSLCH